MTTTYQDVKSIEVINDIAFLEFYRNGNPLDNYYINPDKDFTVNHRGVMKTYINNTLVK